MLPNIEINSLTVNKLNNSHDDFSKYDIEVSLDETENSDTGVKLNYKLILLSNPASIKINVDGMVGIEGSDSEITKQLESDEKNIPVIVNKVYQEIFPLFYILSKSLQIPCPAHKLSQVTSVGSHEDNASDIEKHDVSNAEEHQDNDAALTKEDLPEDKTEAEPTPDREIIEPVVSSN